MQYTAVVPDDDVANLPVLCPDTDLGSVLPQLIEQSLALI